jgi:hypothetical protein
MMLALAGLVLAGCGGEPSAPAEPPASTAPVATEVQRTFLVAARDLPAGHVIGPDDVLERTGPDEMIPPSARTDREAVVGETLPVGIWAGQVFLEARFTPERAFRVAPGSEVGILPLPHLASLVQHGDQIDVLHRTASGVCLAAALRVVGREDEASARVAGPAGSLPRVLALPDPERVVVLRGYQAAPPPLPPCKEGA